MYKNYFLFIYLFFLIKIIVCENNNENVKNNLKHNDGDHRSEHFVQIFNSFDDYKAAYNKTYLLDYQEKRRRKAYEENINRIKKHNEKYDKGEYTFQLRANALADLSNYQYLKRYVRLVSSLRRKLLIKDDERVGSFHIDDKELPETLDWRERGFITEAYNQKSCGSCYAFSIAHSIQGQIFKRTGKIIPLSEQQIVDCSIITGNHGCAGGSLRNTLRYLENCGGLMRQQDYPYTASQNKCQFTSSLSVVNITSWAILPAKDENALRVAVSVVGPIAVSINASPSTFQLYSEGIYDDDECSSNTVNHAMLLIGYTENYWILKNWWGINWGEMGYMKLRRNKNLCGVSNYAAYSIV